MSSLLPTAGDGSSHVQTPSRRALYTVLAVIFIGECSRGLIVPSLYLYADSVDPSLGSQATGWALATFSAGRMVAGLGLGWWSTNTPYRSVCLWAFAVNMAGHVVYILSPTMGLSVYGIAAGRLLVGAGTGTLTVSRAAVAALSSVEDRVLFMAVAGAAQFAGSALMPGVGSLLANLPTSGPLNAFTAPAFLCLVLDVGIMGWLAWRISPTAIQGATKPKAEKASSSDASAPAAPSSGATSSGATSPTVVKVGVAVFIALNFTARGVLSVVVAAGSPLLLSAVNDTDLDPVQDTGEMFLALGVVGLLVFIAMAVRKVKRILPRVTDLHLLVIAFMCTAVGDIMLALPATATSLPLFVIGAGLVWSIGAPIASTVVVASFSKILGSRPQGLHMGLIGAAGSVGRILIPLSASLLSNMGVFIFAGVLAVGCAVAVMVYSGYVARVAGGASTDAKPQYVELSAVERGVADHAATNGATTTRRQ